MNGAWIIRVHLNSHQTAHRKDKNKMNDQETTQLKMDGFNDCIEGVVERFGQNDIICYNKEKVIQKLMSDGGSYEEAVEYHEFNQLGAWLGDGTPCFIRAFIEDED